MLSNEKGNKHAKKDIKHAEREARAVVKDLKHAKERRAPAKAQVGRAASAPAPAKQKVQSVGFSLSPLEKAQLKADTGVLACAHSYACMEAPVEKLPQVIGVGTGRSEAHVFVATGSSDVVANAQGFAYWSAEASGWVPDSESEASIPATAFIGGPTDTGVVARGPMIHYSNQDYAGADGATPVQVPPRGTVLTTPLGDPAGPTGIQYWKLPAKFITGQENVSADAILSSDVAPEYTVTHLSAEFAPDGYVQDSLAVVNVLSGDVTAWSYVEGTNMEFNPHSLSNLDSGDGVDSASRLLSLPDGGEGIVQMNQVSLSEWPRCCSKKSCDCKAVTLKTFAVPAGPTALGAWPATFLEQNPADPGELLSFISQTVVSPQIGFIVTNAQPGARFKVRFRVGVQAHGVETYQQEGQEGQDHLPVDAGTLAHTLSVNLPRHAKPVIGTGPVAAGVSAYAQTKAQQGFPVSQIASTVKTVAAAADAISESGVLSIVEDIGAGLAAMLL